MKKQDEQAVDLQQHGSQTTAPVSSDGRSRTARAEKGTSSTRKVEANRRNALKSTGPKTACGKRTVAKNALKDGFFSKFLLIQHRDGKESQEEYEGFYAGVRKHYQPVG